MTCPVGKAPLWIRLPAWLSRPRVHLTIGLLVGVTVAAPAALVLLAPRDPLVGALANVGMVLIDREPTLHQLLEGMDPARRAALPARLEAQVARLLPALGALGLAGAVASSMVLMLLGRFLKRRLGEPAMPDATGAGAVPSAAKWIGPLAAVVGGMIAHAPFLRLSLNFDEAWAALYTSSSWWAWADTTLGWQNHVGGMLLVRISTALFGVSELSVRLPAVLASAIGLGVTYAWVRRGHGEVAAILSAGLIAALPLWAEQTALCRGYGLAFLAGAVGFSALWKLLDGSPSGKEGRVVAELFAAHLIGFLAHFFFLFFSVATVLALGLRAGRRRDPVAASALVWVVLALVPGLLLYAPGLPATLYQTGHVPREGLGAAQLRWFADEFGFRLLGISGAFAIGGLLAAATGGVLLLPRAERRRVALVVGVSVILPIFLRPVFLYPRFFIHIVPLLWLTALPVAVLLERLRPRFLVAPVAVALAAGLWALPTPWRTEPVVDLREAALLLSRATVHGESAVADSGLRGMMFYLTGDRVRYVNLDRGIPSNAQVIARGYLTERVPSSPPSYQEIARLPGREVVVVMYKVPSTDG